MSCTVPPTGSGFLSGMLANLDCQAQTIGGAGYQVLSNPGSPLSLALTALVVIFVAIIGFRFLAGRPYDLQEWIAAVLKVGFVLALATSWPAYRTVVYDVVLKVPAEIASSIGRASALPGSDGGFAARLQGAENGIMTLVEAGSGRLDISSRRPDGAVVPPIGDDAALGLGNTLFVGSIIGSFGFLRLAGGIFLALAPLFAGFLLFDATRFLFFGWLKSLIAIAIGSVGIAVVLAVELAIIEPWLSQVLALRAARIATLSAPFELLALTLAFSLTMLGVFALSLRISFASEMVTKVNVILERTAQVLQNGAVALRPVVSENSDNITEYSRAQIIAQSLRQATERDARATIGSTGGTALSRAPVASNDRNDMQTNPHIPLGRSYHSPTRRVGSQTLKRKPKS
jgi:type IV secretion system protein VirB6